VVLGLAISAASRFLAAAVNLVDCRPGAAFRLAFRQTAFTVALFDVLSLTLLLVGVFVLVTLRHRFPSRQASGSGRKKQ
jgi:hypothetical protein